MDFSRISIYADGNCFFRCVSSFLNKKLLGSDRFKNGKIKNRELAKTESQACMAMRKSVCEKTERNKDKYSNEIYYDGDLYNSIDNRIEKMKSPGEFAGLVEIKSAAKILKLCFNIYFPVYDTNTGETLRYNLVSKIGKGFHKECNLVLDSNHYEILIPSSEISPITISKPTTNGKKINRRSIEKSDRVLREKKKIKYY